MKNSILIFIIICMCFASIAQDYKLTFSGKESSNVVDSVLVKNLTQGTSIKLGGKDTLILVKETTGISNISKKTITEMEVYPNPFSNECALSLYTPTNENICLQVIDISGKMLISQNRFIEKGNHIFKLSGIPRGMHLVRILSSNYSATKKIISANTGSVNPNISYYQNNVLEENIPVEKSALSAVKMQPYRRHDNIVVMLTQGYDLFDDYGNFLMYRGFRMTEPPFEEDGTNVFEFTFYKCEDKCGNKYATVEIGDQVWMAENFKCKTDSGSWVYDDNDNNADIYGRLYTWEAAIANAPEGWHLPDQEEWDRLLDYQMQESDGNLISTLKNETGWQADESGKPGNGLNSTGFSIMPAGARWFVNGTFYNMGNAAYFWTATKSDSVRAFIKKFTSSSVEIGEGSSNREYGFSVRYVKDKVPIVSTLAPTDITANSVSMNGEIESNSGQEITQCGVYWSKTNKNPGASDNVAIIECKEGDFGIILSSFDPGSTYYYRAFAANSKGIGTGGVVQFTTSENGENMETMHDVRDSTTYAIIKIGTQWWMAENLAYLPAIEGTNKGSASDPFYYVYAYNGNKVDTAKQSDNYKTYGVLYNWPAAVATCPQGWHLPTENEWLILEKYLGDNDFGYNGYKEDIAKALASQSNWDASAYQGTPGHEMQNNNKSGFNAQPGGYINYDGFMGSTFSLKGFAGSWWTADSKNESMAIRKDLYHYDTKLYSESGFKKNGYSVRCVKD